MKKTALFSLSVVGLLAAGSAFGYSQRFNVEANDYQDIFEAPVTGVVENVERQSNEQRNDYHADASRYLRWRNYMNEKNRDNTARHLYNQRARHNEGKKDAHVNDVQTLISRTGELEDRTNIQEYARQRVEAANYKQVRNKRLLDYYVKGGYALPDAETMAEGNVDGMNNQVQRRYYPSGEYIMERGAINFMAKAPQYNMNTWRKEVGAGQQDMYAGVYKQNYDWTLYTPYNMPSWLR